MLSLYVDPYAFIRKDCRALPDNRIWRCDCLLPTKRQTRAIAAAAHKETVCALYVCHYKREDTSVVNHVRASYALTSVPMRRHVPFVLPTVDGEKKGTASKFLYGFFYL